MERLFRILWGPTLETPLDFTYPVVGETPRVWRQPRIGSEQLPVPSATDVALTGRDYFLAITARYFDLSRYTGATGLQAFIDWANAGNAFTLVPDLSLPTLTVPGCFLDAPTFDPSVAVEVGGEMTLDLLIRHPTTDLSVAWRGLFFEFDAGQASLAGTFTRATTGYEITWDGYLKARASGEQNDGHYPDRTSGLQTMLMGDTVVNDVAAPEDLSASTWLKNEATIQTNVINAPDQNLTADLIVPSVNNAVHTCNSNNPGGIAITALDPITALCFVRDGGYENVIFWINDATTGAGANRFGISLNMRTGVTATQTLGTATLNASKAVQLAGGWWMIWIRGNLGGTIAVAYAACRVGDNTGAFTFSGDGSSGVYFWGCTVTHGTVRKHVATYAARNADVLTFPWTPVPQAQWDYAKFVEWCPDTDAGQTYSVLQTGDTGFVNPRAYIVKQALSFTGLHHNGVTAVNSTIAVGSLNPGDTVEVLRIIDANGAVTIRVSVNGGAEQSAGPSGALAFASAWNAQTLSIGNIGGLRYYFGLASVKSGPYIASGPASVASIAVARNV